MNLKVVILQTVVVVFHTWLPRCVAEHTLLKDNFDDASIRSVADPEAGEGRLPNPQRWS